ALLGHAKAHPHQPSRRWALPLAARLEAREGDVSRALSLLDELAQEATTSGDRVAAYAAAHREVLATSVAGDWPRARAAVGAVRATGEAAHFDPTAARLEEFGLSAIIDMFEGRPVGVPAPPIEWRPPAWALASQAGLS